MVLDSGNILLIGSILLFISVIAGKAGYRFGVPALLLFLCVGMLFGSDGVGIVFNSPSITQFIGIMALSIILFSGGMDTSFSDIRPIVGKGIALATAGVLLTTAITGYFIYLISGSINNFASLTIAESLLLAAVMSSTDSASVFSILRTKKQGLKQNLRPLLEFESGSNDPMAYMLTILLIQIITIKDSNAGGFLIMFLMQIGIGSLMGYLLGHLALITIRRINIDNKSLYSVLLLACVFFIFSFTNLLHGNGYLAVYIAGLIVGNGNLIYKKSLRTFFDGFAWLFQIVMFLTLGLLVNPSELWKVAGIGLLISLFMIIIARPATVFLTMWPFKGISTRGKLFISWVGLRGAVPIIFATYPMLAGIGHSKMIFNVVFFITIVSLLIQGTTVGAMAKWLKLSIKDKPMAFDIDLPDNMKAALSEMDVTSSLLIVGDHLKDLTLPKNTLVVMVKRNDHFFVPRGNTKLQNGDKLLLISENDERTRGELAEMGIEPLK